ncbi:MAG: DUF998 domain-containing protein, partial [Candidatus Shapirobacteria bacterium]|nr:DUF998 domain-containing protein [Candidatus Shapirobacteria bacterium]
MKPFLKFLLICGFISTLIYIATDIFTGLMTPSYSFNSQTVSELSAIGAPTKSIWALMTFIYNPLLILFSFGIFQTTKNKVLSFTIAFIGILGFIWLFFPMNLRGSIGSSNDSMHLVMVVVTIISMITMIISGANSQGKNFRLYSIITLIIMTLFGIITGQQTANVAANLPTPMMGITERFS